MKMPIFFLTLVVIHLIFSQGYACDLPLHNTNHDIPAIPEAVTNAYCNSKAPFESFLLIRAAILVDKPVYRVISLEKDSGNTIIGVRLLQFLGDGTPHPRQNDQEQDKIFFNQNGSKFEAMVKGNKTTASFSKSIFEFKIHRVIGGLTIRQHMNNEGKVTIAGKDAKMLLIQTIRKKNWRWVLSDGTLIDFKSNRLTK